MGEGKGVQLDRWYASMKPPQNPRNPRSFVAERVPPREKVGSTFSVGCEGVDKKEERGGDASVILYGDDVRSRYGIP
jgi:hypothetical protein